MCKLNRPPCRVSYASPGHPNCVPCRHRLALVSTSRGFREVEQDLLVSETTYGPTLSRSDGKDVLVSCRLDVRGNKRSGTVPMDRRGRFRMCIVLEITGLKHKMTTGSFSYQGLHVDHELGLPGLLFRCPD